MDASKATYKQAGVDIDAGELAVKKITQLVQSTFNSSVITNLGGYAGIVSVLPDSDYLLAVTTDGVGTKTEIAKLMDKYDTIGFDLIAMLVDDLICVGANPVAIVDYLAIDRLDPVKVEQIISGITKACQLINTPLVGGEMAEHNNMVPNSFDLSGTAIGIVKKDNILGPDKVQNGDAILGIKSKNLRSNGFSLARYILLERCQLSLKESPWPEDQRSLGEILLEPCQIYTPFIIEALKEFRTHIHGLAHITGGGLERNLSRVIPANLKAEVDFNSWQPPLIFKKIQELGNVDINEMRNVFNMGIGMTIVADSQITQAIVQLGNSFQLELVPIGLVCPL